MDDSGAPAAALGALPALTAAVAAFLRGAVPAEPYRSVAVGSYVALSTSAGAGSAPAVVLLRAEDGAVYAPADAGEELRDVLRALRLRPTTTSLTLRLPGGLVEGPARAGRFFLWASPAYLAAGGAIGEVWK